MPPWFRRYLLPGLVFQSIIIAGGYGTGREAVEFFLEYGAVGGLPGMVPATILVSLTCMVGFEFARAFGSYDYRSFFRRLLGPAWFTYEIGYLTAVLLVAIGVLVFRGTATIERFLAGWSFLLYGAYAVLFAWSIARFGDGIGGALGGGEVLGSRGFQVAFQWCSSAR